MIDEFLRRRNGMVETELLGRCLCDLHAGVAHCGKSVAGSHVHSLVLTDIASGWTEAAAMVVREQTLVTLTVEEIRGLIGRHVDPTHRA